jgi:hypothetical protein
VSDRRGFLRDNAFLVAAVLLPLLVVGFFLLAAIIPRWTVAPPAYDLVLRVGGSYDPPPPKVVVEYRVRDGRVEAVVTPLAENGYAQAWRLVLAEHPTMNVRELPVDLPDRMDKDEPPRHIAVTALANRHVLDQTRAPDGYELRSESHQGPGLFGDLFGMHHTDQGTALINGGRVVEIPLPSRYGYYAPVYVVGWIAAAGQP